MASVWSAQAEDWQAVSQFSSFPFVPLSKLVNEEVEANRTPVQEIPSALAVETLFFLPCQPETAAKALLSWNPTSHKELSILTHRSLQKPVKDEDFDALTLDPNRVEQRWLIEADKNFRPFHLSKQEIERLMQAGDQPSAVVAAWKAVLKGRATAYQEKGVAGLEPYEKEHFAPQAEMPKLLQQLPKVEARFKTLLAAVWNPAEGAGDAFSSADYWENMKVDKHAAFLLGRVVAMRIEGRWQVADFQYYVSSEYNQSLILYEIWPASFQGTSGSLVWRGDYVLSPSLAYAHGMERMFSENVFLQEVKKAIGFFRRDLAK
ncbi:MAG: hypothetical protein V1746_05985 [bacterium]